MGTFGSRSSSVIVPHEGLGGPSSAIPAPQVLL